MKKWTNKIWLSKQPRVTPELCEGVKRDLLIYLDYKKSAMKILLAQTTPLTPNKMKGGGMDSG